SPSPAQLRTARVAFLLTRLVRRTNVIGITPLPRDPAMTTRRQFLSASAALAAPLFVPASALGRDGKAPPSDRVRVGVIGTGGRGNSLIRGFLREKDVDIVAVCDVDERHL